MPLLRHSNESKDPQRPFQPEQLAHSLGKNLQTASKTGKEEPTRIIGIGILGEKHRKPMRLIENSHAVETCLNQVPVPQLSIGKRTDKEAVEGKPDEKVCPSQT